MALAQIRLYNTFTRQVDPFTTIIPGEVRLYCCGPTVYNYPHIGNMRTYVFEDLLVRTLRYAGYKVKHVMNITDVGHLVSDADAGEDKMLVAAKREGKKSTEIADYYTNVFFEHCQKLNILRPDVVCRATEHIEQMIALIKSLEINGLAYVSGGNVYFDVAKFPDYGKLARLNLEQLRAGARIEVDEQKHSPLDFALWFTKSKFSEQEMKWNSPWGEGYPGWHIECSAMSQEYLGNTLDIHCGGIDHIPVHHTNEIAQSEGATGKPFVRFWLHAGFLVMGKDKMAKSSGEFLTVSSITERDFDPLSYRLFCLSGSYRNELSWSWQALEAAANTLKRLKHSVIQWKNELEQTRAGFINETSSYPESVRTRDLSTSLSVPAEELRQAFEQEIFNDLNYPNALAVLHQTAAAGQLTVAEKLKLFLVFDEVLGLGVSTWQEAQEEIPEEVLELAGLREAARKNKDWKAADELRGKIAALGYAVTDHADGPKIERK
jgi:cysteinyl-tRNA synthetase